MEMYDEEWAATFDEMAQAAIPGREASSGSRMPVSPTCQSRRAS